MSEAPVATSFHEVAFTGHWQSDGAICEPAKLVFPGTNIVAFQRSPALVEAQTINVNAYEIDGRAAAVVWSERGEAGVPAEEARSRHAALIAATLHAQVVVFWLSSEGSHDHIECHPDKSELFETAALAAAAFVHRIDWSAELDATREVSCGHRTTFLMLDYPSHTRWGVYPSAVQSSYVTQPAAQASTRPAMTGAKTHMAPSRAEPRGRREFNRSVAIFYAFLLAGLAAYVLTR